MESDIDNDDGFADHDAEYIPDMYSSSESDSDVGRYKSTYSEGH